MILESEGDGFCFFHSIVNVLTLETDLVVPDIEEIAHMVITELEDNFEEYEDYYVLNIPPQYKKIVMVKKMKRYFQTGNYQRAIVDLAVPLTCKV